MNVRKGPTGWMPDQLGPRRSAALRRFSILDTPPEPEFDGLVRLAAIICNTEWAAVNLIDDKRQWSKARLGPGDQELPVDLTLCAWAIQQDNVSIVPDVLFDPVLASRAGNPPIRFYAAAPVLTADGLPIGTVAVADPTPRTSGLTATQTRALSLIAHQAEALLLARDASVYREAFQTAPIDMVLIDVVDDETFIFADLNVTHQHNAGLDPSRFIGSTPEQVLPAGTAAFARAKYTECIRSGQVVSYEQAAMFPSGERIRRSLLVPLKDATGRVVRILLTSIDMTELQRIQAQLRQAQKMEIMGQLTGGLAHDFNNLLSVIMGNLELAERVIADPEAHRRIALAQDAAQRGGALIQQLLTFGRKQTLQPVSLDLHAVIRGMRDLLERSLGGYIRIAMILPPDLWEVAADPTQLESAVLNLAINARDAMPGGGEITIETRNLPAGHPDGPEELSAGDFVGVAVADNGAGMPEAVLERAIEPFFTTKPAGKGSGLGLAQVYGFARDAGGTLRIASTIDVGTRVELFLPRVQPIVTSPLGR
jgi:signal transduction histidine kinase